jgi:hypothetical protein
MLVRRLVGGLANGCRLFRRNELKGFTLLADSAVAEESRKSGREVGERLKQRIFETVFPRLAQGFVEDRKSRVGAARRPTDDELRNIYEPTLTLLYRLLFLLYAESRELLPARETPYCAGSLTTIAEAIAAAAGNFGAETALYDRVQRLCAAIDRGDAALNVPRYGGGLFVTMPDASNRREQRVARFLAMNKVPDRFLAAAIDALARDGDDETSSPGCIDYESLAVRHLGSIYEGLLEFKLRVADGAGPPMRGKPAEAVVPKGQVYLSNDKAERKAGGSYYTPEAIVKYIVEQTVGPALSEKLDTVQAEFAAGTTYESHPEIVEQLFDFRVLDPAMGSGHFLVEAADFITNRLLAFLNQFAANPVGRLLDRSRHEIVESLRDQGITVAADKLTHKNLLKRHVLERCIYGIDLNPMAVELAKASLWIDAFAIGMPLSLLDRNLRCGNSLIGPALEGFSGFDAVVGNPPYAGHKGDFDAAPLKTLYAVCRSNPNPAAAFLEYGFRVLRKNGRLGMLVPKSIQYVESWKSSRQLLSESNNLIGIADVSQAFDGVLLEQTVCLAAKQAAVDGYEAHTLDQNGEFSGKRIAGKIAESLGCFPVRVDRRSLALLRRILNAGPRLSEIGTTSQALGYQSHLNKDVTGVHLPIHRGKQIRPMRIDAPLDFIDRSYLTNASSDDLTAKVSEMLRPKVVSQNIVAHVMRPKPRVWIISAPDPEGILCLNTISTTILHDGRYPIEFIAAILNSTLASWFYTEFVFCRAIRTMHFDNYYAGKLPIAEISPAQRGSFETLARTVATCDSRDMRQRTIDSAVFDAYGLSNNQRRFLYAYCHGTDRVESVLCA